MEPVASPSQTSGTAPSGASISEPINGIAPPPKPPTSLPIKPLLIALILLIVLGAVAFGLMRMLRLRQGTQTTANRPVTLTYWGLWESNDVLQSVIKEFESQNQGVTIQYSEQSPKDYNERLQSAFARGQGPDIFRLHATWTQSYTQKGLLAPVPSNVVSASEFTSNYYPFISTDLKTSQGYMGVPLMIDGLGLYVNKRILTASGRSAPTTWEELRALGRDLTVRGPDNKIERSGVALGSANNVDHFSDILATLIFQNGGNPANPMQKGSDGAYLVGDALLFYSQFMTTDKAWDETLPNSTYAFAIEKTAMIIAPSWRAYEIREINPNFEFEVYPIPQLPGKPVTWASYWVEGVAKSSKEQETAWKFLKYMSSKETMEKLYTQSTGQGLPGEIYPRSDMADKLVNDKYAGAYVRQAPNARSWYMASRTFDNGVNDQIIKSYKEALNTLGQDGTTRMETILNTLNGGVTQVLTTFGVSVGGTGPAPR